MHLHRLERSYVVKSLFREKAKSEVYHSEMNLVKRNIPWGNNTKTKLYTIKRIYTKYLQRNRLKKLSPPRNLLSVIKNSLTWKIGEETQYIYIYIYSTSGFEWVGQYIDDKGCKREGEREGWRAGLSGKSRGCQQRVFTSRYFLFTYYLHPAPSTYPSTLLKQGLFDLLRSRFSFSFPSNLRSRKRLICYSEDFNIGCWFGQVNGIERLIYEYQSSDAMWYASIAERSKPLFFS